MTPNVKKVAGFHVYLDELLGKGQYGSVYKAKLASESKKRDCKIYACKIMEIANIDDKELACIEKEVKIHSLIRS